MGEELRSRFERAGENVTKMSKRPDGPDLLKLYALFKQGTEGNNKGERPGMLDFVKRAKFDAWKALEGVSNEDAMQRYVDLAESLIEADKKSS